MAALAQKKAAQIGKMARQDDGDWFQASLPLSSCLAVGRWQTIRPALDSGIDDCGIAAPAVPGNPRYIATHSTQVSLITGVLLIM
jgi:hypothetical protein